MSAAPAILLEDPAVERERWLSSRRGRIGGSQIAKIVGLSPYGGPLDAYLEIMGISPPLAETRRMRRGITLEPVILSEYEEATGRRALSNGLTIHTNPEMPCAIATPDAFCVDEERGVELKKPGLRQLVRWGEPGTDQIPDEFLCQVTWYMLIKHFVVWDVAAWIGGFEDDLGVYSIELNTELANALREAGERFHHDHILPEIPPGVDASEAARRWIESRYPRALAPFREATPEEEQLALELRDVKRTSKSLDEEEARLKNLLRDSIGEAAGISGSWGRIAYRNQNECTYTVTRKAGRVLDPRFK